ncbi:hypothetical protein pEaSNUABM37_00003 [Erwinia phage pEa_SNUABM_37]|nr:hypothetical protein pEaSNUABM37_00003 [Erwinia phage pEa_SNUABM_37]QXO10473.1 hypothetical protein pEaSNUABM48_00003 [Erwinia phage pEa_SNUABM_48]
MYQQFPQQPQYPQQPMMAPQQYQPYGVQPQQMPQVAMPNAQDVLNALVQYVTQNANQTQIGAYIYQRGTQGGWQDQESATALRIAQGFLMHIVRSAPGIQPQQALTMAIQQTYEVMVISALSMMPQMVQSMPQPVLQGLLQNLPQLQQAFSQATQLVGLNQVLLQIPGYSVQQQPQYQPIAPQTQLAPQYQQYGQPQQNIHQQYASPMVSQPVRQPGQQSGAVANNGYSNARPVIPPAAGVNHLGVAPIDIGKLNIGTNRVQQQQEENLGISARKVNYGAPLIQGNLLKSEPVQQPVAPQQPTYTPPVQAQPVAPQWNNGVLESHSTPTLAEAIHNQLNQDTSPGSTQYPSDINFDSIMSLDTDEEAALFNAPNDNANPMPSMTELFGATFGANKATHMLDPMQQALPQMHDTSTYAHHVPAEAVVDLTAGMTTVPVETQQQVAVLSKDGLPDGWLFTEKHYDADSTDFYNILVKAKRHKTCPWPIGYDRRFCSRLYRYMEDGSIEQKIVGVSMDRLKHDISLLDTPVPTAQIRDAEMADFGPLTAMNVNEAVKIVKDPEVTQEIIDEKLGENSIFVVDKPVYALSRQEAILLTSLKVKPLMEKLEKGVHGFETQIREISLVTSHPNVEAFLNNEHVNMLTQDSTATDLMQLAEAIRAVRAENLLPDRSLRKITEYMRETLNTMLHADYGYSDELELEDEQAFEDELVDFMLYMNQSPDDLDVLQRITKNWDNVRARLCTLLTGKALESAQQQLGRRYDLPEEERKLMLDQMSHAILLQSAYSVTTMARTAKQIRAVDNQPAFVTMASERPYLHQLMTDIKKRGKASGATLSKHFIITLDGIDLAFTQAGLGNGNTFPTFYVNY